jgi:hypothetical protein
MIFGDDRSSWFFVRKYQLLLDPRLRIKRGLMDTPAQFINLSSISISASTSRTSHFSQLPKPTMVYYALLKYVSPQEFSSYSIHKALAF